MNKLIPSATSNYKVLLWFSLAWFALNTVQAACLDVDADEAYYWLYALHLQWGYFDHPPLVAISIKLGELFGHGSFYTRLGAVLFSAGTVYFGYKLLPERLADVRMYILIFASVVLFHVYGFITTPDSSLLFFTTIFFYAYRKYSEKETVTHTLLLALGITGMLYSKYHGILPVAFVFLSYPKLIFKPSAWAVVLLVLIAFSPHLWWQYGHDWPTFRYHLSERIASRYKIEKTLTYLAGQLLIWGPLTTIPAFIGFFKRHQKPDLYMRAHLFNFCGVLLFFLLSSFRSSIEPHWTLVAGPSFVVLLQNLVLQLSLKQQKIFSRLFIINILLILLARVLFLIPDSPIKKVKAFAAMTYARSWADSIHTYTEGNPVVFADAYRFPSLYKYYYPNAVTVGYNTVNYRKTQFNIYNEEAKLNNKRIYAASPYKMGEENRLVKSKYINIYLQPIDSFRAVNSLKITGIGLERVGTAGKKSNVIILLENRGENTVETSGLTINYTFLKTRNERFSPPVVIAIPDKQLPPGYKKSIKTPVLLPKEPGTYHLIFSIVQAPFSGSFASPFYKVVVVE